MKRACITIAAICLTFAAGTATGRVVQLGYDKPSMKTDVESNTLRVTDGCKFTRTEGGNGSFLNYVCAERPKTGMMR